MTSSCSRSPTASATTSRSWCANRWATPIRWTCPSRSAWALAVVGTRPPTRRLVSREPLEDGRCRAGRIDAVCLFVLQREHSLVTEAAVDPIAHEGELDHLIGESL